MGSTQGTQQPGSQGQQRDNRTYVNGQPVGDDGRASERPGAKAGKRPRETTYVNGQPVYGDNQQSGMSFKKPLYKRPGFWIAVIVIVFFILPSVVEIVSIVTGGDAAEEAAVEDEAEDAVDEDVDEAGSDDSSEAETDDAEEAADEQAEDESELEDEEEAADESAFDEPVTIYDDKNITVDVVGAYEDAEMDYVYYEMEVVNDSKKDVIVEVVDVSIDDLMADSNFYETVMSGKRCEEELRVDAEDPEDLMSIEGTVTIMDKNSYEDIASEPFSLK